MTLGPLGGCYLPFLPQDDVKTGRFQSCFPIQDRQDVVPLVPQAAKASKGSCSWLGRSLVAAEHLPWDWPTSERHVKNARRCVATKCPSYIAATCKGYTLLARP